MKATYQTQSPEETIELGEKLAYRLSGGDAVLLFGDLGSGKTHFTKGVAKGLGITEAVKSPTFTYVNQYQIEVPLRRGSAPSASLGAKFRPSGDAPRNLYHYDLYRLSVRDDTSSLGLEETLEDLHAINVIEWADRLDGNYPHRYVRVDFKAYDKHHTIGIEFVDPGVVPSDQIEKFYEEWGTPLHVRDHIKQVTNVAMQVAAAYIEAGEIVDLNWLYSSAMLHDIARVCDFRELERSVFKEEITDEKWAKWVDLRKVHKGIHHADIAAKFFRELGYSKTADLVYAHKSRVIVEEPELLYSLESKILYYADKRVKHDEIVTLKERFRDGRERYGKYDDAKTRQLFDEIEKKTFELENELFVKSGLNLSLALR